MTTDARHVDRWQPFLMPGEELIHTFGVGRVYIWVFRLLPGLLLVVGAGVIWQSNLLIALMLLLLSLLVFIPGWYLYFFVHYAITDHRVLTRTGLFHKHFVTVDLSSITDILVKEYFFERIFTRTALVGLNTAGSDHIEMKLRHVSRPFEKRRDIYKHQHELLEISKHSLDKAGVGT